MKLFDKRPTDAYDILIGRILPAITVICLDDNLGDVIQIGRNSAGDFRKAAPELLQWVAAHAVQILTQHRDDAFAILSGAEGYATTEEYCEGRTFRDSIKDFRELIADPDIRDLFTFAQTSAADGSSGSVPENTEDGMPGA